MPKEPPSEPPEKPNPKLRSSGGRGSVWRSAEDNETERYDPFADLRKRRDQIEADLIQAIKSGDAETWNKLRIDFDKIVLEGGLWISGEDFSGLDLCHDAPTYAEEREAEAFGIYPPGDDRRWNLTKVEFVKCNFRKARLQHVDFSGSTLSDCDFTEADLRSAKFIDACSENSGLFYEEKSFTSFAHANLTDADLRGMQGFKTDFSNAIFYSADLTKMVAVSAIFSGAQFDDAVMIEGSFKKADFRAANLERANLSKAKLSEANLSEANLTGATLTGADLGNANLKEANLRSLIYDRATMRGNFRDIRGLDAAYGDRLFVKDAKDQDYLDTIEEKMLANKAGTFAFWLWGKIDYGRSIARVAGLALGFPIFFGLVYFLCQLLKHPVIATGEHTVDIMTFFYFSVVTFSTVGFGDMYPVDALGEILVILEIASGFVSLALVGALLAKKIGERG